MKVIYIGTYNTNEIMSGPEKVCKRIFEEYSKTDKTLFIHYFHDGRKYRYLKKLFGYEKTADVNGSEVLRLGIFCMLYKIVKLNPQVIHILCFNRFVLFLYLLKIFLRVNIFYTLNGIIRHENKYYNKESLITVMKNIVTENVIIYSSDRIFYLSEFSKNILYLYYSPDNTKLTKVRNGLDNCFLEQEVSDFAIKEYNSVVFIGNIDQKEKGFDLLLRSIIKCGIKIKLYIIDSLDKVSRFSDYPNIEIIIVDKMSPKQMVKYLKNKSIVVAPGEYDTFNISVLEAASCGLYPILSHQTGVSEFISDYFSSLTFDYDDKVLLMKYLIRIINGPSHYCVYKDLDVLSWNNVVKKYYVSHYD